MGKEGRSGVRVRSEGEEMRGRRGGGDEEMRGRR